MEVTFELSRPHKHDLTLLQVIGNYQLSVATLKHNNRST